MPTCRFLGPSPSHSDASPSATALGTWFSQAPEGFLSQPRLGSFYTASSWNTDERSCPRPPTPTPRCQRLGLMPIPHRPHPPSPRTRPLAGTEHFFHVCAEHLPRVKLGPTCQKQEGMEGQQENGGGNRYSQINPRLREWAANPHHHLPRHPHPLGDPCKTPHTECQYTPY